MIDRPEFSKKQILFLFASKGEKISFRNDNVIISDKDGKIKYQMTCYRIFMVYVIGDTSITTGVIKRAKKFGFVICLMTQSFKLYSIIGNRMEGNTLLHQKQYEYQGIEIARFLVDNKMKNQINALKSIRKKSIANKEAIAKLDTYRCELSCVDDDRILLGIEGTAARVYFPQIFDIVNWKGRKPRTKSDHINTTLDIGYSLLFQLVDSLLQVYGFDVYCGVYHKAFYMRKSLVCDLVEPLRPIIDVAVRKAINLHQCKEEDFEIIQNQYCLSYKKSPEYISFLMEAILKEKENIFLYIQNYYRCFMKEKDISQYRGIEVQ